MKQSNLIGMLINVLLEFQARNYIKSLPVTKKKDFSTVFRGANPLAIDLLEKMLELDADKRITAEQALAHSYLEKYADPNDEPTSPLYDQSFEDMDLPVEKWKGKQNLKFKMQKSTVSFLYIFLKFYSLDFFLLLLHMFLCVCVCIFGQQN